MSVSPSLMVGSLLFCGPAVAQTNLIVPNWSDKATAEYLERRSAGLAEPGPLADKVPAGTRLSLPVLGLRQGFAAPEPDASARGAFIDPLSVGSGTAWWPACAKQEAEPAFDTDANGTRYGATFDFGCVTVVVIGDRFSDPQVPAALREELGDLRGDGVTSVDEDDDPGKVLSVSYALNRFNIPYNVTIECTPEAATFCANRPVHQILLGRLSILAGEPRP